MINIKARHDGRINHDVSARKGWKLRAEKNTDRPTARVGDDNRSADTHMVCQSSDICRVLRCCVSTTCGCRATVAAPVHTHDAMAIAKVPDLMMPMTQIAAPTVNQDQRRFTALGAFKLEKKFSAVIGAKYRHESPLPAQRHSQRQK